MTTLFRRCVGPALLLAVCACVGCNPGALAYFLLPESLKDPEVKSLASPDGKEVKVAILAYAPGLDLDLAQSDRQLCELLTKRLHDQYERNRQKVTLLQYRKVEEFRSANPDMLPREIGKHFKVDYVIALEINGLSIYDKKGSTAYNGRADISVTLIDVNKPGEDPERREFNAVFPDESHVYDTSDMPPLQFRLKFLDNCARKLTRYFAGYPSSERYDVD